MPAAAPWLLQFWGWRAAWRRQEEEGEAGFSWDSLGGSLWDSGRQETAAADAKKERVNLKSPTSMEFNHSCSNRKRPSYFGDIYPQVKYLKLSINAYLTPLSTGQSICLNPKLFSKV